MSFGVSGTRFSVVGPIAYQRCGCLHSAGHMIKAIILDLDNCLAAADEPGRLLLDPTFEAIRQANHGTVPEEMLERALTDCWRHSLDWVARKGR